MLLSNRLKTVAAAVEDAHPAVESMTLSPKSMRLDDDGATVTKHWVYVETETNYDAVETALEACSGNEWTLTVKQQDTRNKRLEVSATVHT